MSKCKEHTKRDAEKSKWYLQKIEIELDRFGDNPGVYKGKVSFSNGHFELFRLRIRPEMAAQYISLIAEDLVKGATNLGQHLIESLGLNNETD